MSQLAKARALRDLHASPFVIPNPWDAGSAKVLAVLGFPALTTTSAGAANVHGVLDGQAGRDAILTNAAAIVAAVDLPVAADLENGYDDPAETIRLAAAAGLANGLPVDDLVAAGATRISLGSQLFRAALGGFVAAATEIRDHGTFGFAAGLPTYPEVTRRG